MKKVILNGAFILAFCSVGFSQVENPEVSKMKLYPVERKAVVSEQKEISKEEEIQNCKNQLEAIDTKEAWLKANPEELKVATEAGWFEDAKATREKLLVRIKELENN